MQHKRQGQGVQTQKLIMMLPLCSHCIYEGQVGVTVMLLPLPLLTALVRCGMASIVTVTPSCCYPVSEYRQRQHCCQHKSLPCRHAGKCLLKGRLVQPLWLAFHVFIVSNNNALSLPKDSMSGV